MLRNGCDQVHKKVENDVGKMKTGEKGVNCLCES